MKKIIALILAMLMCFGILAACGSKEEVKENSQHGNHRRDLHFQTRLRPGLSPLLTR